MTPLQLKTLQKMTEEYDKKYPSVKRKPKGKKTFSAKMYQITEGFGNDFINKYL